MLGSRLLRKGRELATEVTGFGLSPLTDDERAMPSPADRGLSAAAVGHGAADRSESSEDGEPGATQEAAGVRDESGTAAEQTSHSHPPDSLRGQESLRAALPTKRTVGKVVATAARLAVLSRKSPQLPNAVVPLMAIAWAALVGYICALLLTIGATVAEHRAVVAEHVWLAGHQVAQDTSSGRITLLPLGLMLITMLPLRRAGRFVAVQLEAAPTTRWLCATAVAGYAAVVMAVAASTSEPVTTPVLSAGLWAALVAVVGGGWGFARERRDTSRLPIALIGAAWAIAVPLVVGAVLTVAVIIASFGTIAEAQSQLAAPGLEQGGLIGLQLLYLPNFIVWAGAYVIGTGFCTGGLDQVISPFSSADSALPALPLFSALPHDSPQWSGLLPVCVALGGAAAAMIVDRRIPQRRLASRIGRVVVLSVVAGFGWFVLGILAGGSLGDGRLDYLGPAPGTPLVAAMLTCGGGLLWALLPTMASDAKPVAVDLRSRVARKAAEAKSGDLKVRSRT